jgi:mono/diheme cytochrome c family protein
MAKKNIFLSVFFAFIFFAPGNILLAQDSSGNTENGKAIFGQNCAVCHGSGGDGQGIGAAGMSPPPANFTDPEFWKDKTDTFLAHVISNGIGQMPGWSESLTPDQIRDVIAYIKTLKKS